MTVTLYCALTGTATRVEADVETCPACGLRRERWLTWRGAEASATLPRQREEEADGQDG